MEASSEGTGTDTRKIFSDSADIKDNSTHSGLLKIDATCADAEVRYPTDLDLIHDGVEIMDRIIGRISTMASVTKPKTHVKDLHSRYLNVIKLRNKPKKKINECKEYLLTWLGGNIYQCIDLVAKTSSRYFEKLKPNRKNRRILRLLKIEIGGKPLGRPAKEQQTKEYQQLMAKNVGERNEVEATFGTAKRIYRANNIRAKLPYTGTSWTACCYFAKIVKKFLRELLYALILMIRKMEISVLNNENYYGIGYPHYKYALLTRV